MCSGLGSGSFRDSFKGYFRSGGRGLPGILAICTVSCACANIIANSDICHVFKLMQMLL